MGQEPDAGRWFRRFALLAPIVSGLFTVTALHHAWAVIAPRPSDTSAPSRHLLFVGINAAFAVAFARQWRGLAIPCLALAIQQTYSHGRDLVASLRMGGFDIASAAVLAALPCIVLTAFALGSSRRPALER